MKLNSEQISYLLKHFTLDESAREALISSASARALSDEDRHRVLNEMANKLQQIGFDSEYDLTHSGRLLESLIDAFRRAGS